jgi:flagellar protein FlaG
MIGQVQDVYSAAVVTGAAEATVGRSRQSTSQSYRSVAADQDAAIQSGETSAAAQLEQQSRKAKEAYKGDNAGNQSEEQRQKQEREKQAEQPIDEATVSLVTQELNELMSKINCNLQFQYHKEVNMMSVRMIDKRTNDVLKEIPPEEMIKHKIHAREWIGNIIDKEA